ncbi:MAG: hypothetical protein P8M80_07800 [Pirellulaceae bacterium]|nr:hypothetical protein [Pirellulaceae bacterium]
MKCLPAIFIETVLHTIIQEIGPQNIPALAGEVMGRIHQSRLGLYRETVLRETGQEETLLSS